MNKPFKLLLSVLVCHSAGLIGSLATRPAIDTWYAGLEKPFFNPPNWLFAPAWLTLYTFMGIALYLIWEKGSSDSKARRAILLFLFHLAVNALWSIVFFGWQSPFWALVVIFALWLMIGALIFLFWRIRRAAAFWLVPYWLWVTFAAGLNFFIWRLN